MCSLLSVPSLAGAEHSILCDVFGSLADICSAISHVRFTPPESGHRRARPFRHCVVLRRKVKRNHHFCDLRHRRHRRRTPINQLWATIARRGFHASSVVQLRAYPCCLHGCLSCTADGAARGWRRCGSPGVVEQMGALVFRCPTTHEPFRSNFRATPEELKRISGPPQWSCAARFANSATCLS